MQNLYTTAPVRAATGKSVTDSVPNPDIFPVPVNKM